MFCCTQALLPKPRPSTHSIDAALMALGGDSRSVNLYQTALAKDPPDYFGFIG